MANSLSFSPTLLFAYYFDFLHDWTAPIIGRPADGWRGLFKGVGARVMFHAPATALTIALYEQMKVAFTEALSGEKK